MKANTLYQFDKGNTSPVNRAPQGFQRVSLFEPVSTNQFNPESNWDSLVTAIKVCKPFFGCVRHTQELSLFDLYLDENSLQHVLQQVIQPSGLDYLIWPGYDDKPQLLVFDMDSTFIEIEVIDELAKRHGVGDSVAKVTEAAMRGELDFSESLISRVACIKGLSDKAIESISANLPLSKGVASLVENCHKVGVKVAIVSGGFTPFVSHLKEKMDLYRVKANDLEMTDGVLSGKVKGQIVDGAAKASFVKQLANELALSTRSVMTIGDGANDLEMMKVSGFSLAYRAKPAVQALAGGRMNHTFLNHLSDIFDW